LGISIVGHRRKLLDAIAALRGASIAKPPLSETSSSAVDRSHQDTAERRQVTVMFSDLVGSTTLSARTDPEDLREIISAYQKCVAEAVRRFGGFVARYMGDGVLVTLATPRPMRMTPTGRFVPGARTGRARSQSSITSRPSSPSLRLIT